MKYLVLSRVIQDSEFVVDAPTLDQALKIAKDEAKALAPRSPSSLGGRVGAKLRVRYEGQVLRVVDERPLLHPVTGPGPRHILAFSRPDGTPFPDDLVDVLRHRLEEAGFLVRGRWTEEDHLLVFRLNKPASEISTETAQRLCEPLPFKGPPCNDP